MVKQERGFEDLDCYRLALQVVREAYDLAKRLPDYERYDLARQFRRAASSSLSERLLFCSSDLW